MKSHRPTSPLAVWTPWFAWSEFMFKSAEMMMASGQVIGHRVERMAKAGPALSSRDLKEFTLMGHEKLEAAAESTQAMSAYCWQVQQQAGTQVFEQMVRLSSSWWNWGAGGRGGQPGKGAPVWSSDHALGLMNKALAPIHSRATANARRLGRR